MSDKEFRSMDKTQLLKIMRQQELEIEKLTFEKNELATRIEEEQKSTESIMTSIANITSVPSVPSVPNVINIPSIKRGNIESADSPADSFAVASEIIQSAQEAADLYLKNIRLMENKNMNASSEYFADYSDDGDSEYVENPENPEYSDEYINFTGYVDSIDFEEFNESEKSEESEESEESEKIEEPEPSETETALDLRLVSYLYINLIDKAHNTLHEMLEKYKLISKLPQINEFQEINGHNGHNEHNEHTPTGDYI